MPRGGRPLVTLNAIPSCCRFDTASAARFVSTFSCVTSVPSTSAITIRIGFAGRSFFDAILQSFLTLLHRTRIQLLLLVVPQQPTVDEKRGPGDVIGSCRSFVLMGVSIAPGAIELMVILLGASSMARFRVSILIPPLLAQ